MNLIEEWSGFSGRDREYNFTEVITQLKVASIHYRPHDPRTLCHYSPWVWGILLSDLGLKIL